MDAEMKGLRGMMGDAEAFSRAGGKVLRAYQREVADAVIDSVIKRRGLSFAVMFPRQSGKNELQAQIEAYLLLLYHTREVEIVKISPTWRPQAITAMRRLERVLCFHPLAREIGWSKENGYSYRVDRARISFFSGEPTANIVGATASLLLEVDEAQNVDIEKYDTQIAPMAASTDATRVFWGTAWTADTLLARELRAARAAETADGVRRAFRREAEEIGRIVPAYARFVAGQVALLGREHPSVRTQYFSEEIDARGGLFSAERILYAQGEHAWLEAPRAGESYVFLIDVGGEASQEDEAERRRHDSTALAVVALERAHGAPRFRLVHLWEWQGVGQPELLERITALARAWNARRLVVDATGLGAGLAAGLERALPGRVTRFVFSAASKSQLGWDFLGLIESKRFHLPVDSPSDEGHLVARLRAQMRACEAEVGAGPGKPLRWEVPARAKAADGTPLHDDLLVAAALTALLDGMDLPAPGPGLLVRRRDALEEMDAERGW